MNLDHIPLRRFTLPVVLVVLGFAHRGLMLGDSNPFATTNAARWFFAPDEKSPLLVIPLCAWLIWRRRERLHALGPSPNHVLAAALLVPALVLFCWAQYIRAADLQLYCLSLQILGWGTALAGARGCRALLLPALVLLIAAPIPAPLYNDVVWQLQTWTTDGAALLLSASGFDIQQADALIRIDDRAFVIVESCSGLRGMEILLIAAVTIREVFSQAGTRVWLVVLLAPFLAAVMNVVRVASIVLTDHPGVRISVAEGHLSQGLTVIVAGTIVLYLFAWLLARRPLLDSPPRDSARPMDPQHPPTTWLRLVLVWSTVLAVVSVVPLSVWRSNDALRIVSDSMPELSIDRAGWRGRNLVPDMLLIGELPLRPIFFRRYEKASRMGRSMAVELLIAYEDTTKQGQSPFSSKLLLPGSEWSLEKRRTVQLWTLGQRADLATVGSGSALALVYRWHLGEEELCLMTGRSIFGLDRSESSRRERRVVVRLVTPLTMAGPLAQDRAKQILDEFIADFAEELEELQSG